MREMRTQHKELMLKIQKIEQNVTLHNTEVKILFDYIKKLINKSNKDQAPKTRARIGYKVKE